MYRLLGAVVLAAWSAVAGCTAPIVPADPSGRTVVLPPLSPLSANPLTGGWIIQTPGFTTGSGERLAVAETRGRWGLKLLGGPAPLLAAKPTNGVLPISPYLSWSWAMEWQGAGIHPVRIVVGFHGGAPDGGGWSGQAFAWLGSALPPHDRRLEVTWGESALERGNLVLPQEDGKDVPRYTVRGGRERAGIWFDETVDLLDLYTRAWPGDDASRARVVFIGIAAAASRLPVAGTVADIVLFR